MMQMRLIGWSQCEGCVGSVLSKTLIVARAQDTFAAGPERVFAEFDARTHYKFAKAASFLPQLEDQFQDKVCQATLKLLYNDIGWRGFAICSSVMLQIFIFVAEAC